MHYVTVEEASEHERFITSVQASHGICRDSSPGQWKYTAKLAKMFRARYSHDMVCRGAFPSEGIHKLWTTGAWWGRAAGGGLRSRDRH